VDRLIDVGRRLGSYLPWHGETDPFRVLVAEMLLRRTTRKSVARAYEPLMDRFGTPRRLARAPREQIYEAVKGLGLGNQRAQALQEAAEYIVTRCAGRVPGNSREELLSVPHVGDYVADAALLYGYGSITLPLDEGIRRVLRRVCGLPPRKGRPYSDKELLDIARSVTDRVTDAGEARVVHQALLWVLWNTCKPVRPSCSSCPLQTVCVTGKTANASAAGQAEDGRGRS
jgi:A/G-specific adenine glycosylase